MDSKSKIQFVFLKILQAVVYNSHSSESFHSTISDQQLMVFLECGVDSMVLKKVSMFLSCMKLGSLMRRHSPSIWHTQMVLMISLELHISILENLMRPFSTGMNQLGSL